MLQLLGERKTAPGHHNASAIDYQSQGSFIVSMTSKSAETPFHIATGKSVE
jgi:hypothetical protein